MIQLFIALAALTFTISFAFRNKWQFIERDAEPGSAYRRKASQKWHRWQAAVQLSFFSLIYLVQPSVVGVFGALTYMMLFWVLFDGLLNRIALDKHFFYVGTTSDIDRFFQRFGKPELIMAICKLAALGTFATIYISTAVKLV